MIFQHLLGVAQSTESDKGNADTLGLDAGFFTKDLVSKVLFLLFVKGQRINGILATRSSAITSHAHDPARRWLHLLSGSVLRGMIFAVHSSFESIVSFLVQPG